MAVRQGRNGKVPARDDSPSLAPEDQNHKPRKAKTIPEANKIKPRKLTHEYLNGELGLAIPDKCFAKKAEPGSGEHLFLESMKTKCNSAIKDQLHWVEKLSKDYAKWQEDHLKKVERVDLDMINFAVREAGSKDWRVRIFRGIDSNPMASFEERLRTKVEVKENEERKKQERKGAKKKNSGGKKGASRKRKREELGDAEDEADDDNDDNDAKDDGSPIESNASQATAATKSGPPKRLKSVVLGLIQTATGTTRRCRDLGVSTMSTHPYIRLVNSESYSETAKDIAKQVVKIYNSQLRIRLRYLHKIDEGLLRRSGFDNTHIRELFSLPQRKEIEKEYGVTHESDITAYLDEDIDGEAEDNLPAEGEEEVLDDDPVVLVDPTEDPNAAPDVVGPGDISIPNKIQVFQSRVATFMNSLHSQPKDLDMGKRAIKILFLSYFGIPFYRRLLQEERQNFRLKCLELVDGASNCGYTDSLEEDLARFEKVENFITDRPNEWESIGKFSKKQYDDCLSLGYSLLAEKENQIVEPSMDVVNFIHQAKDLMTSKMATPESLELASLLLYFDPSYSPNRIVLPEYFSSFFLEAIEQYNDRTPKPRPPLFEHSRKRKSESAVRGNAQDRDQDSAISPKKKRKMAGSTSQTPNDNDEGNSFNGEEGDVDQDTGSKSLSLSSTTPNFDNISDVSSSTAHTGPDGTTTAQSERGADDELAIDEEQRATSPSSSASSNGLFVRQSQGDEEHRQTKERTADSEIESHISGGSQDITTTISGPSMAEQPLDGERDEGPIDPNTVPLLAFSPDLASFVPSAEEMQSYMADIPLDNVPSMQDFVRQHSQQVRHSLSVVEQLLPRDTERDIYHIKWNACRYLITWWRHRAAQQSPPSTGPTPAPRKSPRGSDGPEDVGSSSNSLHSNTNGHGSQMRLPGAFPIEHEDSEDDADDHTPTAPSTKPNSPDSGPPESMSSSIRADTVTPGDAKDPLDRAYTPSADRHKPKKLWQDTVDQQECDREKLDLEKREAAHEIPGRDTLEQELQQMSDEPKAGTKSKQQKPKAAESCSNGIPQAGDTHRVDLSSSQVHMVKTIALAKAAIPPIVRNQWFSAETFALADAAIPPMGKSNSVTNHEDVDVILKQELEDDRIRRETEMEEERIKMEEEQRVKEEEEEKRIKEQQRLKKEADDKFLEDVFSETFK